MDAFFGAALVCNSLAMGSALVLVFFRYLPRSDPGSAVRIGAFGCVLAVVAVTAGYGLRPWLVVIAAVEAVLVVLLYRRSPMHLPGSLLLVSVYSTAMAAMTWYIHFAFTIDVSALTRAFFIAGIPSMLVALPMSCVHSFLDIEAFCREKWARRNMPHVSSVVNGPKVSVHLPCYAEPPDVVIASLDALARLKYDDFEVVVVDNNTKDPALWRPVEEHCRRLGERFHFFHVAPLAGAKGGALNFALTRTAPDAELVALVDADYQMAPDFLSRLVGHFDDERLGFIQAKYNFRDWQDSLFLTGAYWGYQVSFSMLFRSRNDRLAAYPMGTSCLLRRTAIVDAGGWSESCVTEDSEIGVRIQAVGYTSFVFDDPVGAGLVPETFAAFKKQRFRWTYGPVQQLKQHWRLFLPGRFATPSRMSFQQKVLGLEHGFVLVTGGVAFVTAMPLGLAALISMLVHGEQPPMTSALWFGLGMGLSSALALRWCRYRYIAGSASRGTVMAMVVDSSLSWICTCATLHGILTKNTAWRRTSKFKAGASGWRVLTSVRVELALALVLTAAAIGAITSDSSGFLLLIGAIFSLKSIVYYAAVGIAFLAEHDLRRASVVAST
ncbi:glycosyltransferase family 2 protein [Kitasatospora sp. NPDC056138]|uniref:glycosyltransferase family 2 protein n=1 Tax=Kitasatospora sp. NPDC056138 TaxID=3345724 RepID=UPI0035E33E9D